MNSFTLAALAPAQGAGQIAGRAMSQLGALPRAAVHRVTQAAANNPTVAVLMALGVSGYAICCLGRAAIPAARRGAAFAAKAWAAVVEASPRGVIVLGGQRPGEVIPDLDRPAVFRRGEHFPEHPADVGRENEFA